jgi:hypothetical protein
MDKVNVWFKDNKNVGWLIAGIAVVLIIVVIVLIARPSKKASEVTIENQEETALVAPNKAPTYYNKAPVADAPATPKLSYGDAVRTYGSNRIQFGETCLATPATAVFKKGSEIMLDNRSWEAKTFTVNGTAYSVAGQDYAIAPLNVLPPSQDVMIDCGVMKNVVTITVQN